MALKLRWCLLFLGGIFIIFFGSNGATCQHVLRGIAPASSSSAPITSTSSYWIISITTKKLNSYNDPQLKLKPVVRARIGYGSIKQEQATAYEDLWYGTDEPALCLGARRYNAFTVPARDYVAIRVLGEESPSVTQTNAATDAIVRSLLDAQLNDDWIEVVIVPDGLFKSIKDNLHYYNIRACGDSESAVDSGSSFDFVLRSESGREVATMVCRT
jgi:hypothetical protein